MTVTFDKHGGKTKLTMHMVFETAEELDTTVKQFGAIEDAKQTLERLKRAFDDDGSLDVATECGRAAGSAQRCGLTTSG